MRIRSRFAIAVFGAFALLVGCEMRYRDVSGETEHKDRVGSNCELLVPLRAHGVTNEVERDKKTDYISIWDPGFTGPEVTFVVVLEPGTRMRVLTARECTNCLGALVEYRVDIIPQPVEFAGKPAFLRAESLAQKVRCKSNGTGAA